MIAPDVDDLMWVAEALGGCSVKRFYKLPVAQRMQLRTAGLAKNGVKFRPAGGGELRSAADRALGRI